MNIKATLLALLGLAQVMLAERAPTNAAPRADPAGKGKAGGPQLITHTISAREARSHGLPPLGFSLAHESPMMWTPFPEPDVYVTMSGPPGGTLVLSVLAYEGADSPATLEQVLRARAAKYSWQPLSFGKAERLPVAGEPRDALGFIAHQSMARARYCGVLVPSTQGAGFVVLIGHSLFKGDDASCAATAAHPMLAPAMKSFRVLR